MSEVLVDDIYQQFVKNSWTWKIAGERVIPSLSDISKTLDGMRKVLYAEADNTQIEVGRLIMKKITDGKYDVYIFLGDYNDEDS